MTTDAFTWVVPVLDLKNKFERIIRLKIECYLLISTH